MPKIFRIKFTPKLINIFNEKWNKKIMFVEAITSKCPKCKEDHQDYFEVSPTWKQQLTLQNKELPSFNFMHRNSMMFFPIPRKPIVKELSSTLSSAPLHIKFCGKLKK